MLYRTLLLLVVVPLSPLAAEEPLRRVSRQAADVRVELFDGSRIVGTTDIQSFSFDLGYDQLEVPIGWIRKLQRQDSQQAFLIELNNEDRFHGQLNSETLKLHTGFGDFELAARSIQTIYLPGRKMPVLLPDLAGLIAFYGISGTAKPEASEAADAERLVLNLAADQFALPVSNMVLAEDSDRGEVLSFSGNTTLSVPHDDALCPEKLTVSAWIQPTGSRGSYSFLLGKTNEGGSWSGGYAFVCVSGDPDHVTFYVNGYTTAAVKAAVKSGQWTHLTGVCDGSTIKIYADGRLVQTATVSGGQIQHTTTPLNIGGDSGGYRWQGKMDDIAIYNRALSDDEVRQLYEELRPLR